MEEIEIVEVAEFPVLIEWDKDLREASRILTPSEARFLVDAYYTVQEHRIATKNQARTEGEPNRVVEYLYSQLSSVEQRIKTALDIYTSEQEIGRWLKGIYGIGPVISAGLIAHIDITKAPTAGHIWSFAGLNPEAKWEKGARRPWNARLKVLAWKAGESFVKFSGRDQCYYGKLYLQAKALYTAHNEAGRYAADAARYLTEKDYKRQTVAKEAYMAGKLPPGQIHARARRWAVKIFLSHLHHVWYKLEYKEDPPRPFAIDILGHAHIIPPPGI